MLLHSNSELPGHDEEMPVAIRCIAIGCNMYLVIVLFCSFCKQVISTLGTKHFIGKSNSKWDASSHQGDPGWRRAGRGRAQERKGGGGDERWRDGNNVVAE